MSDVLGPYVYVLTNSCWGERVKIGRSDDIENIQVSSPDLPEVSKISAILYTSKSSEVMDLICDVVALQSSRDRKTGNDFIFIPCSPQKILKVFQDVERLLDDAKIIDPNQYNSDKVGVAPNFKFSMIGLVPGDEIVFDPTGEVVVVSSDNTVKRRGGRKSYRLSPFVREFIPKKNRVKSGSYQGPKFFSYKGKILIELRKERGK